MRKKIIAIAIIGLFLLTGLQTISAETIKEKENKIITNSDANLEKEGWNKVRLQTTLKSRSVQPEKISGDDFPILCPFAKKTLSLLDTYFYYYDKSFTFLFALLIFPRIQITTTLMKMRDIQNFSKLDCHCSWDKDDFPNIPEHVWHVTSDINN